MQPQQIRTKTAAIVEGAVQPRWQPPNDNSADGAQDDEEEEESESEEEEETHQKKKKKKSGEFQPNSSGRKLKRSCYQYTLM